MHIFQSQQIIVWQYIKILRRKVKLHTPSVYIMCKKCETLHEVCIYNTHGFLIFTVFLQNVYTKPDDGLLRQIHAYLAYGYIT
jgi:hypothetical protein